MFLLPDLTPKEQSNLKRSSFYGLSREDFETHYRITRYNSFELSGAVAPAYDVSIKPEAGYQLTHYATADSDHQIPLIIASVSKPELFSTFFALAMLLAQSSKDSQLTISLRSTHTDPADPLVYTFNQKDPVAALSTISNFEDEIVADGFCGISVVAHDPLWQLTFDEHKILYIFSYHHDSSVEILERYGVPRNDGLQTICSAEHVHISSAHLSDRFNQLRDELRGDDRVRIAD